MIQWKTSVNECSKIQNDYISFIKKYRIVSSFIIDHPKFQFAFIFVLIIKILCCGMFSSDYMDGMFIPFVNVFLSGQLNPWEYAYTNEFPQQFPYPPIMLFIIALAYLPVKFFGISSYFVAHLLIKIPILISDLIIFYGLSRIYPYRYREVFLYYFISPIVFYSSIMHSQLDIIPTACLVLCLMFIKQKDINKAAICFGIALGCKGHLLAAWPILLLYFYKNNRFHELFRMVWIPIFIYTVVSIPFVSDGYIYYVLHNNEQMSVLGVQFQVQDLSLYLAIIAILIVYFRSTIFNKINFDLMVSLMGLTFAVFLALTAPMPGWFVWIVPFVTAYYIQADSERVASRC